MMCGSNQGRYGYIVEELRNNSTKCNNDYPVNTTESYNLLINYKTTHYKPETRLVEDPEEIWFSKIVFSKGKLNSYKSGGGSGDQGERKLC